MAEKKNVGQTVLGCSVIGTDEDLYKYPADQVNLVNGIGYIGKNKNRENAYKRFKELGYIFEKIIHPNAMIADDVQLGEGAQVMAGSIVQVGSVLNGNCIINTNTSVDHDCVIGNDVHLAPGVTVCGKVHIGSYMNFTANRHSRG